MHEENEESIAEGKAFNVLVGSLLGNVDYVFNISNKEVELAEPIKVALYMLAYQLVCKAAGRPELMGGNVQQLDITTAPLPDIAIAVLHQMIGEELEKVDLEGTFFRDLVNTQMELIKMAKLSTPPKNEGLGSV